MEWNIKLFVLLIGGAFLVQFCSGLDVDVANLNQASFKLFLEALRKDETGANLVVSPVRILSLVALYAAGTTGRLQSDIVQVLGATNINNLIDNYADVTNKLQSTDALASASKIFARPGSRFTPNFINAASTLQAEFGTLDFSNPRLAAAVVNSWASQKTRGLINDPVTDDTFSPSDVVALFNAIYFQGNWVNPFEPSLTKYGAFTTRNGNQVQKPMMSVEMYTDYAYIPGVGELAVLPYKENDFKMVIGLPDISAGGSVPMMLQKLSASPEYLQVSKLPQRRPQPLDIKLPKFNIENKLDMKKILEGMGLGNLFSLSADNLVQGGSLAVSGAFQKAVIKVDEKGTTAAAVSGLLLYGASQYPPLPFYANRPFLFAILQKDSIVFLGAVTQ